MGIKLPLNNGEDWEMPPSFEQELNEYYTDVAQEMAKARLWLVANPHRRKTLRGIRTFCINWMKNSGKIRPSIAKPTSIIRAAAVPITQDQREAGKRHLAGIRELIHR